MFSWLSFVAQNLIIVTGGAVRLTGSGLGCDTWPKCTEDSWVTTPEQGIHGAIEFGNRLMTFLLIAIAITLLILLWKKRHARKDLWTLAIISAAGIPGQAVVGGITVWTDLNPYVVGLHYLLSAILVCVTAALLVRVYETPGPRVRTSALPVMILAHLNTLAVAAVFVVGMLSTGSGPHAGDARVPRNGLDVEFVYHLHANLAYVLFALTLVLLVVAAVMKDRRVLRATVLLLAIELVQIVVGIAQARLGLPEILVVVHMLLAALSAAAVTVVVMRLKTPETDRTLGK